MPEHADGVAGFGAPQPIHGLVPTALVALQNGPVRSVLHEHDAIVQRRKGIRAFTPVFAGYGAAADSDAGGREVDLPAAVGGATNGSPPGGVTLHFRCPAGPMSGWSGEFAGLSGISPPRRPRS